MGIKNNEYALYISQQPHPYFSKKDPRWYKPAIFSTIPAFTGF